MNTYLAEEGQEEHQGEAVKSHDGKQARLLLVLVKAGAAGAAEAAFPRSEVLTADLSLEKSLSPS